MLAWFSIARPCLPTAPNGRSREGVSETSRAPLGQKHDKTCGGVVLGVCLADPRGWLEFNFQRATE